MKFIKRLFNREPRTINGYRVREVGRGCPGCGAKPMAWCSPDCNYLDLMDYR